MLHSDILSQQNEDLIYNKHIISLYIYIYMYVCMCIYIYMCTHTHTLDNMYPSGYFHFVLCLRIVPVDIRSFSIESFMSVCLSAHACVHRGQRTLGVFLTVYYVLEIGSAQCS